MCNGQVQNQDNMFVNGKSIEYVTSARITPKRKDILSEVRRIPGLDATDSV